MILRFLVKLVVWVAVIAGVTVGAVRLHYGGGADFPDRHPAPARLPEAALEKVADLPTPPGNIAVSADNRVFVSLHPEAHPKLKVAEIAAGGKLVPFPTPGYQDGSDANAFEDVLGIRLDAQNRLWTLDSGHHGLHAVRLMAFDIGSFLRVEEYTFPKEIAGPGSHFNDLQVSPDGKFIYIADASFFAHTPAIVVYDVARHTARRVLQSHPSVLAEKFTPVVKGRRMEMYGLVALRPGVDSIALDAAGEWLYFAPVTNLNLSRVRTADLRDEKIDATELAGRVEVYAPKPMSDGLAMDDAGTVYIADPEHDAIVSLRPDRTLETLVQSDKLRWPDGLSFGGGGQLYVTCSSLNEYLGLSPNAVNDHAPYQVFRVATGAQAAAGH